MGIANNNIVGQLPCKLCTSVHWSWSIFLSRNFQFDEKLNLCVSFKVATVTATPWKNCHARRLPLSAGVCPHSGRFPFFHRAISRIVYLWLLPVWGKLCILFMADSNAVDQLSCMALLTIVCWSLSILREASLLSLSSWANMVLLFLLKGAGKRKAEFCKYCV